MSPRCASSVESGVFEVRDTPTRTRSAFLKLRGSLPSSLFTANSTASMRRKYSSRERQHRARHVDRLAIEERAELADERADDVDRLDPELGASIAWMNSRSSGLTTVKTTSAPSLRRALEDRARDLLGAHARVQADLRARLRELQQRGADDLLGGLAGRVAQHVDVAGLISYAVGGSLPRVTHAITRRGSSASP